MANTWTGERLETFVYNESTIEHLHRYAIAKDYVQNKIVLDIACGEGYGASLLSGTATSVLGVDKDKATILKAKNKYSKSNLEFLEGMAENIPCASETFDVVVSFETLEHLTDHDKMLSEIKRVLKPGGMLIISTPEKANYSDLSGYKNPYHSKELYEQQFKELVGRFFHHQHLIYQKLMLASVALHSEETLVKQFTGNYEQIETKTHPDAVYLIAIASDQAIEKPCSSLFSGHDILQTALHEKEKALKNTLTYRIGNFILSPLKLVRKVFKK